MLMVLNWNKRKFDDFIACLFICSLCNIFVHGHAYAYKTYEYIWKLASTTIGVDFNKPSECQCQCFDLYSALTSRSPCFAGCASTVPTKMAFAGAWKQLRWSSDCWQDPENCSRRTDQQWQKPGGGRTCWAGDVVRAVVQPVLLCYP